MACPPRFWRRRIHGVGCFVGGRFVRTLWKSGKWRSKNSGIYQMDEERKSVIQWAAHGRSVEIGRSLAHQDGR